MGEGSHGVTEGLVGLVCDYESFNCLARFGKVPADVADVACYLAYDLV